MLILSLKRTLFIFSIAAIMVAIAFTPALAAVNQIVWRKILDDTVTAERVATDRNGNVIVAGYADDGRSIISKLSGGSRVLWTRQLSRSEDGLRVLDVVVNSGGDIYVAGESWELGSFISKYGPRGGHHWTREVKPYSDAWIRGIDVGPGGNIYLVGATYEPLPNMTQAGELDAFIRKYNQDGKVYWTRQFSLDIKGWTEVFDVAVGPGGGVYVVGYDDSENRWSDGLFLRKYSPRGGVYWTRRINRQASYFAYDGRIAVDRVGGVTIVSSPTDNMSGEDQAVAVKYTHKGRRLWTRTWDGHVAGDVAVDRERNIYIVGGSFSGKAGVRKYNSGGTRLWTRYFAGGFALGAAADSENNLYVTRVANRWDSSPSPSFLAKFRR